MKEATDSYVEEHREDTGGPARRYGQHGPIESCLGELAIDSDTRTTKSVKDYERIELRKRVSHSAQRFLTRCYKAGLIDLQKLKEASEMFGLEI